MIYFTLVFLITLFGIYFFIKKFCKNGKCCEFIRTLASTAIRYARNGYELIQKLFRG